MKAIKYMLGVAAFATCIGFTSCKDDDSYDVIGAPDNFVYVSTPGTAGSSLPKNTVAYKVFHTPAGSLLVGEPDASAMSITAKTTKVSNRDITVNFAIDLDAEVPGYAKFPAGSGISVSLDKSQLVIPAGSSVSTEQVNITVTGFDTANLSQFTEEGYLIPIRIIGTSEGTPSQDYGMAYVGLMTEVKTSPMNVDATSNYGVAMDRSAWTGTMVRTEDNREVAMDSRLWDDNERNYAAFLANPWDKCNCHVVYTLDLGSVVNNVTGFNFHFYYNWYTCKEMTYEYSVDGSQWNELGTVSNGNGPLDWRVVFWGPTALRYVRATGVSMYGGTGEGQVLAEIYGYVSE